MSFCPCLFGVRCPIHNSNLPTLPTGWICPRCGKVHAPTVTECDCQPPIDGEQFNPDLSGGGTGK